MRSLDVKWQGGTGIISIDLPCASPLIELLELFELESPVGVVEGVSTGRALCRKLHVEDDQEVDLFPYSAGGECFSLEPPAEPID